MKLTHPAIINTAGLVTTAVLRRWMDTLDLRIAHYDRSADPAFNPTGPRTLFLFWHEYVLMPLDRRGKNDCTMLLSRHRDGDVAARVAKHQGFGVIRGSTHDGASQSLRELIQTARTNHITITPDGPRGPRRVMAVGPIYLASKLRMPIVPMGYGYDRPWRVNSWDRFAIPRPFSRGRSVWGPMMYIPPKLDRDGLEYYRREVERMINRLTLEAEAWAESGTAKQGELAFTRDRCDSAVTRSVSEAQRRAA